MFCPRLQLTSEESRKWIPYSEPGKVQKNVLYRIYNGELNLSETNIEDSENIQISRRARVFALTASGDVPNVEVSIYDSTGEQYTPGGFVPLTNLLLGTNLDYRGTLKFDTVAGGTGNAMLGVFASPHTGAPHIFEPNIVLLPNQTLTVKGRAMNPLGTLPVQANIPNQSNHVSFNFHVWEFPLE